MHKNWERPTLIQEIINNKDDMEDLRRSLVHAHSCDAEGCGGKVDVKTGQFVGGIPVTRREFYSVANGDGLRVISGYVHSTPLFLTRYIRFVVRSWVCGAYHSRRSKFPCSNTPPGKKKRAFCDVHRAFEHKCKQMTNNSGVLSPCHFDIDGPLHNGCPGHNDVYHANCAQCIEAVVPKDNRFCTTHVVLEGHAAHYEGRQEERYLHNLRRSMRGKRRQHVREESNEDIDIEEGDDENLKRIVADELDETDEDGDDEEEYDETDEDDDDEEESEEYDDEDRRRREPYPRTWSFRVGRYYLYGYYMIVKPCGYILWASPLFRSEGCKRTVAIWNDCFRGQPKPNYAWTDSGCKIWRYVLNNVNYKDLWESTRWLVDRFHGKKSHNMSQDIQSFCAQYCDLQNMTEAAKDVAAPGMSKRTNSQAQEQVMAKMGKLVWTYNMNHIMQWFTIFWITLDMNTSLVSAMHRKGRRYVPKPLCLYR